MALYANWQSSEAQTFVFVGSTPTDATSQLNLGGSSNGKMLVLHAGDRGSIPRPVHFYFYLYDDVRQLAKLDCSAT